MKITGIQQIMETYKANRVKKTGAVDKVSKKDEVAFSSIGKDFQTALKAVSQAPDLRMDKVQELQQKMQLGTYTVDAKDAADKMVERIFDAKI